MKLIIEDDEGRKTVVPFVRDEISIGRNEGNTIRLTERNVSRRHARFVRASGHVFIEDLGSYNGVKVNGEPIQGRAEVLEGDLIEIGDYNLAVQPEPGELLGERPPPGQTTAPAQPVPASLAAAGAPGRPPSGTPPAGSVDDTPAVAAAAAPSSAPAPAPPRESGPRHESTAIIRVDLDALGKRAQERALEPHEQPSLVVLSTEFAGQTYVLDRTVVTIGRTDENDIELNHRSMSRKHARLFLDEEGTWKVADLGSANGVRVNGETYGLVEVQPGDIIELGHVELRFCAPGEDYVYQPEEEIPSAEVSALPRESRGGMPLPVVIAGAAGLLAVAIAGVWWASSGTAKKDTVASKDGLYPIGATADHPVKKAEPPATKPPEAAPSKKDEKLRAALQKASEAVKAQDWKAAKEAYQEALAADPSNAAAKAGFDRVSLEEVAFEAFQEGKTLLTQEKWMDAAERFAAVPAGTLLFEQAKAQAKYARSRAADKLRQEAQRALKAKDYRSAITVAKAWLVIDPSSSEALRIVEQARAARSHRPPHGRNPGARSSPKTGASEARAKEAKAYLVKGMESYNKRKFELAVKHFKRAIELDPVGQRLTHRALGSAYARMGKMDKAAEQYRIYLRKNPTAPDAPQIRQILAKYDASKGGG